MKNDGQSSVGRERFHTVKWAELQTTQEIVDAAKVAFPQIKIDFDGVHVEYARQMMQEMEVFQKFYPKTIAQIHSIQPGDRENFAMSAGDNGGIYHLTYNRMRSRSDPVELNRVKEQYYRKGFLTGKTFRETVRHELFHMVHYQILHNHPQQAKELDRLLDKTYHEAGLYKMQYDRELYSQYAMKIRQGGSPLLRYTELHSEMGVLMWKGSQKAHIRELRKIHKELQRQGVL